MMQSKQYVVSLADKPSHWLEVGCAKRDDCRWHSEAVFALCTWSCQAAALHRISTDGSVGIHGGDLDAGVSGIARVFRIQTLPGATRHGV